MLKNLDSYVLRFSKVISENICNDTIKEFETFNWKEHKFYSSRTGAYRNLSGEKELETSSTKCKHHNFIMKQIWNALDKYIKKFNFAWHPGWEGYTGLKFQKYSPGRIMKEHCDHIHDIFDGKVKGIPTLSIIGLLNDDFEGGDLVMFEDKKMPLKEGDLLIFPSNFLYPHKVNEVKKGTRYTLVSWSY